MIRSFRIRHKDTIKKNIDHLDSFSLLRSSTLKYRVLHDDLIYVISPDINLFFYNSPDLRL